MFTSLLLVSSWLVPAQAAAPPISSGVTLSTGFGATFDGDPATVRLQIQGEIPIQPDDDVGLGLVLPVEFTSSGESSFGLSTSNSLITFVPSLRVRLQNDAVVRPYGDVGAGLAFVTANADGWLFHASNQRAGFATRFVLGLEIGDPEGGVAFVIEPIGIDTLHFGDRSSAGWVGRIGLGMRY